MTVARRGQTCEGRCFCDATTNRVAGSMRSVRLCQRGRCRRDAGHGRACATARRAAVSMEGPVAWLRSRPLAERGVCPRCGSSLVWRMVGEGTMPVSLGSLDTPTGPGLERRVLAADKGDDDAIQGDLPRSQ